MLYHLDETHVSLAAPGPSFAPPLERHLILGRCNRMDGLSTKNEMSYGGADGPDGR